MVLYLSFIIYVHRRKIVEGLRLDTTDKIGDIWNGWQYSLKNLETVVQKLRIIQDVWRIQTDRIFWRVGEVMGLFSPIEPPTKSSRSMCQTHCIDKELTNYVASKLYSIPASTLNDRVNAKKG